MDDVKAELKIPRGWRPLKKGKVRRDDKRFCWSGNWEFYWDPMGERYEGTCADTFAAVIRQKAKRR